MKKIEQLTLEEKIAQMLCFAWHGTNYNQQLSTLVNDLKVGGVIYFSRNISSLEEILSTNKQIQQEADIPLFIGLDQEGGPVQRVIEGITPFPGAMALAATSEDTEQLVYSVGEDLVNLGFNIVFAPVGDVNNNPLNPVINSRSYSDDPNVVAYFSNKAVKGFQRAKILPTVKHFPGHGDTNTDSHLSLPIVNKSKEEVEKMELIPFKEAIESGADGIMLSHILYPCFDSEFPASLSYNITTKLLKEQLGFKGLIVTDSLTMGAINSHYNKSEIVRYATNAGVDLLIFCGKATIDEQKEIINCFINEVKIGNIPLQRIDESVTKILEYKQKYYNPSPCLDKIRNKDHRRALEIYQKVPTLIKDNGNLPLKKDDKVLIISKEIKFMSTKREDIIDQQYVTLGTFIKDDIKSYQEVVFTSPLIDVDYEMFDKIIFLTMNVNENDEQTKIFSNLPKDKTIVVSLRSPYDCRYLDGVKTYICLYEATLCAFESLAKCLKGENKFYGKLPIKL